MRRTASGTVSRENVRRSALRPSARKWLCSALPRRSARARASIVAAEGLMARPCSSRIYQSTPMPASSATSSRLRPGVRRLRRSKVPPPWDSAFLVANEGSRRIRFERVRHANHPATRDAPRIILGLVSRGKPPEWWEPVPTLESHNESQRLPFEGVWIAARYRERPRPGPGHGGGRRRCRGGRRSAICERGRSSAASGNTCLACRSCRAAERTAASALSDPTRRVLPSAIGSPATRPCARATTGSPRTLCCKDGAPAAKGAFVFRGIFATVPSPSKSGCRRRTPFRSARSSLPMRGDGAR